VVIDHGKPRNAAARIVNNYLGLAATPPEVLRDRGRREAQNYGAHTVSDEAISMRELTKAGDRSGRFEIRTKQDNYVVRAVLFATGVVDQLPALPNIREYYGRSVHHCPYCDGWEHRDQQLVAYGSGDSVVELALLLHAWSPRITVCSDGNALANVNRLRLSRNDIPCREDRISELIGENGQLSSIAFVTGTPLPCDALFFSSGQRQASPLPAMIGCLPDDTGLIPTGEGGQLSVPGCYMAGDANGKAKSQLAIVAAAEGAVAAMAIHQCLQESAAR
jgi:thioredoxin reductase